MSSGISLRADAEDRWEHGSSYDANRRFKSAPSSSFVGHDTWRSQRRFGKPDKDDNPAQNSVPTDKKEPNNKRKQPLQEISVKEIRREKRQKRRNDRIRGLIDSDEDTSTDSEAPEPPRQKTSRSNNKNDEKDKRHSSPPHKSSSHGELSSHRELSSSHDRGDRHHHHHHHHDSNGDNREHGHNHSHHHHHHHDKKRQNDDSYAKARKKLTCTDRYGKYGILRESDRFLKKAEFVLWLQEVKSLKFEELSRPEERRLLETYMEDYNTATLPHKRYYDYASWERKKKEAGTFTMRNENFQFDDERRRQHEIERVQEERRQQALTLALEEIRGDKEILENMKKQESMRNEMYSLLKQGRMDEAEKIRQILDANND